MIANSSIIFQICGKITPKFVSFIDFCVNDLLYLNEIDHQFLLVIKDKRIVVAM